MTAESACRPSPAEGGSCALLLAGPTAVGKSEVALVLAERLRGEIVSVDSMQVYRGMDIGTAKPSAAERARIRHHLIDVAELTTLFDAAQFVKLARIAVADIQSRARLPILCGGTGLYFKALLEGIGEMPGADPVLRAKLEREPIADLLAELAEHDRVTFSRIDRRNPRRIIRAIEVIRLTGRPFSDQQAAWSGLSRPHTPTPGFFALTRSAGELHRRIEARVDSMFRLGLVNETQQLLERGLAENRTASQALGYRQTIEHLRGLRQLPETIELVKIRTRQYAKRQLTWFRRQLRPSWILVEPGSRADAIAEYIAHEFSSSLKRCP